VSPQWRLGKSDEEHNKKAEQAVDGNPH